MIMIMTANDQIFCFTGKSVSEKQIFVLLGNRSFKIRAEIR